MMIKEYTFEEYLEKVTDFHGSIDPDMIAGWFMADLARGNLPAGNSLEAICETSHCLPDAVQILTPCTIGNGLLRIVDTGRFAIILYEQNKGDGIRVFLDLTKLDVWPEIRCWFLKEKPKHKQDLNRIIEELKEAGDTIFSLEKVKVKPEILEAKRKHGYAIRPCPSCGEAYRSELGDLCPACRGKGPYLER